MEPKERKFYKILVNQILSREHETLEYLLLGPNVQPERCVGDENGTLIHEAALSRNPTAMKILIEAGVTMWNRNKTDNEFFIKLFKDAVS